MGATGRGGRSSTHLRHEKCENTRWRGKIFFSSTLRQRIDSAVQHGIVTSLCGKRQYFGRLSAKIRQPTLRKSTRCFTPDNYRNPLVSRPTNRRPSGFRQTQTFGHRPQRRSVLLRLASRAVPAKPRSVAEGPALVVPNRHIASFPLVQLPFGSPVHRSCDAGLLRSSLFRRR